MAECGSCSYIGQCSPPCPFEYAQQVKEEEENRERNGGLFEMIEEEED
jgi:hypothetical protein